MKDYKKLAREVRKDVLDLIYKGQTSHIASCFSLTDVATILYDNLSENDVVIWSKGWAAALHYVLEIRRGNLDRDEVYNTFPNSPYLGLLERSAKTVVTAGGSVGHGLPVAVGMALAKKRAGEAGNVYCIMSDGEMNEGTVWESALIAAHHKLDNLVGIIDVNGWQAMGKTEEVMSLEPLTNKWTAFNWGVDRVDGHNYAEIFDKLIYTTRKPRVLIADTIKGKGVSFIEGHLLYHYKHIEEDEYKRALAELT